MDRHSAHIEMLTAEVKVLQVGSRQVTLSVYRQLDWAAADEIEPFGRVRDKPEDRTIEVVGSHRGVLSRARAWTHHRSCSGGIHLEPGASPGRGITGYWAACEWLDSMETQRDRAQRWVTDLAAPPPWASLPGPPPQYAGPVINPEWERLNDEIGAHKAHEWDTWHPSQDIYEKFGKLELIVLAGLR